MIRPNLMRADRCLRLVLVCGIAALGLPAVAQSSRTASQGAQALRGPSIPQRETAARLLRPVTINFDGSRLEDVIRFITEVTSADIDVAWIDDKHAEGLDKDQQITLKAENTTYLGLIEIVLEEAEADFSDGGNTWQFNARTGALEIGPKSRLNTKRRVEVYGINDLLTEVPEYTNAPDFDLNTILQSSRGGGGQSPFTENDEDIERRSIEEKVDEIIDIIQEIVEPEQWADRGGDAASIRYWQGNLIVNAPDYVHRQLNGYPWWPSRSTSVAMVGGRRWVTLDQDSQIAELEGIEQVPVSAVVGGQIIRSDDPGGGG